MPGAATYQEGEALECLWRDRTYHPCRVLERRALSTGQDFEYYVHYSECTLNSQNLHSR